MRKREEDTPEYCEEQARRQSSLYYGPRVEPEVIFTPEEIEHKKLVAERLTAGRKAARERRLLEAQNDTSGSDNPGLEDGERGGSGSDT